LIGLFGHRTRDQLVQISECYTKTFPGKYLKEGKKTKNNKTIIKNENKFRK